MHQVKLYDTMARKVRPFEAMDPEQVKIYTCGPTVYDYPHIGNWYAFIRWDILNRVLITSGYKTKWVMNITDVGHLVSDADDGEDKLEKGAKREGKTAQEVANFYTDYFKEGLNRLNFNKPNFLPRATEHVDDQIKFVQQLVDEGFAYIISDGVYFDTSKSSGYGKLARLDTKNLKEGARVKTNPEKRSPTDFALWKFSPKDSKRDMEWNSPWGAGFPGWHLECSTLALKFLGETIDIHSGGIDHIPVHHLNEIAQSEALNRKPLANYWLHSNFVQVNGQKMSKSLRNLITLEDIVSKGYSLEAFRLLVLESHYRSEAQFTWETIAAAQNRLNKYRAMSQLRFQPKTGADFRDEDKTELILDALNDDLDTPLALSLISGFTETALVNGVQPEKMTEFTGLIKAIDNMLGLKLTDEKDISDEQKNLIKKRELARISKDWVKSDEIRDTLKEQGIELRDTSCGPIWNRL